MNKKLMTRILKKAGIPDLLEILSERLSLSDLQSLLLEVYRRRSRHISPARILSAYGTNRFVLTSQTDPSAQFAFDKLAYSLLPGEYEVVTLSPVCPLGTVSSVAPVNQNNILSTIRNTEVCSDGTNVLALECACRRQLLLKKEPRSKKKNKIVHESPRSASSNF